MSAWAPDGVVANHNGNGFPHVGGDPNASAAGGAMIDPAALMANPGAAGTPPQFNPAQFANPQQVMAMQNGPMRNASPSSFGGNPVYQTNSVIPSKRPRPREDSMSLAGSPTQNPGMLPTSRADTPQQQQPSQQPPTQGQQPQQSQQFQSFSQGPPISQAGPAQSPYPHLQPNGSANATPSPIMANQMRPGSVPQRVSTASPHPFSPAAQNFAPQASPIPSEHGGTPQPNPYMQGQGGGQFPPGFNPNFTPTPSPRPPPSSSAMPGQMMPQNMGQMSPQMMGQMSQMNQMNTMNQMAASQMQPHMLPQHLQQQMAQQMAAAGRGSVEQSRMMYQMQLQRQMQQGNMQMPPQMPGQAMSPQQQAQQQQAQQQRAMMNRPPMPNGQMQPNTPMKPQQQQQQQQQQGQPVPAQRQQMVNPDAFMKQLSMFMSSKQLPLETNPMIGDRPVSLVMMFQFLTKYGGYRNVSQQPNGWANVSNAMGWHPAQYPQVPAQLKGLYERNLVRFEEWWTQNRMKQQQQQQQAMATAQGTPPNKPPTPGQAPSGQMMQPGQQVQMSPGHPQSPIKQVPGTPHTAVNGIQSTEAQQQVQAHPGHARNSLSSSVHPTPTQEDFPMSPDKAGPIYVPGQGLPDGHLGGVVKTNAGEVRADSDEYLPVHRPLTENVEEKGLRLPASHGGLSLQGGALQSNGAQIEIHKPNVPLLHEMGNIDLAALTRSLQCGIHGEVRLALDHLAIISKDVPELHLDRCDDLVESLIECAEEQIEFLAENTDQVSDEILLAPYEEVARACRLEGQALHEIGVIGTKEYDLDRAADRLICVTTILRNLSIQREDQHGNPVYVTQNQAVLGDETVIKFLCVAIRYLGTRNMLLRNNVNTLDFIKDIVILLSNVASFVEIPGREQALCLVHFLLCFAPTPSPTAHHGRLFFTPYEPSLHPYMMYAVEALAKLLARDVPNRTHYKTIFALDATSSPPYELLTRTFALAIAPIPDQNINRNAQRLPPQALAREPFLMQGLLAADVLASLAPGYDTGVTKSWLEADNAFARHLLHLINNWSSELDRRHAPMPVPAPRGRGHQQQPPKPATPPAIYIACLGVSILRKLTEKARDPADPSSVPPPSLEKGKVLAALQMQKPEWTKEGGFLQQLMVFAGLEE